jgi:hypothetical protein
MPGRPPRTRASIMTGSSAVFAPWLQAMMLEQAQLGPGMRAEPGPFNLGIRVIEFDDTATSGSAE